jgi:hypothetical protein
VIFVGKKPKSNKEAWLLEHFADPRGENVEMSDADVREARRVYKKRRTKILRQEGKKEAREAEREL